MTAAADTRSDHAGDNPSWPGRARDHLWLHSSRMGSYADADVPVIVRGDGAYVFDQHGKRYLDGLSGLYAVQVGHGRRELAQAGARQAEQLAFFPIWSYAHPQAISLAERLSTHSPGDLNRVFFVGGGSEAVESAWKVAKQYFKLTGRPLKTKAISRVRAYHGTTAGALALTGIPEMRSAYEPLVPGAFQVANTDFYRAPEHGDDVVRFGVWAADQIEAMILAEGADTVAAVFLEPVQNSGGCFTPPPGYFQRVREICDRHDVLLVSDEVICGFGRLGTMFASERYGYTPDLITCAKGITSGYAPLGAMIASDRIMEPFLTGTNTFAHGHTFGGHPVSCAVAHANLDVFEREDLLGNVRRHEDAFRATLEKLLDLPIVGDVRGDGYFFAVELVRDRATRATFDAAETERLLRGFIAPRLFESGLHCRSGGAILQVSPPLICGQEHFDEIEQIMRATLTEAWTRL